MNHTLRGVLNLLMFVMVLVVNGLAGSGALSGRSVSQVAAEVPSHFLPANWAFGIWSLIYLALFVFAVYSVLPRGRHSAAVDRIGALWLLNGVLNMGWLAAFTFGRFVVAWLLMLGLLGTLIATVARLDGGSLRRAERWLVAAPFELYLAWVSMSTIANTSQLLNTLSWDGLAVSGPASAIVLMVLSALLAGGMVRHRLDPIFPLVVAWTLWGIADRFDHVAEMATVARALTGVLIVAAVFAVVRTRSSPLEQVQVIPQG